MDLIWQKIDKYVDAGVKFVDISLESINPKTHSEKLGIDNSGKMQLNPLKNTMKRMFYVEVSTEADSG